MVEAVPDAVELPTG
jgi:uncharacterized membrane protein